MNATHIDGLVTLAEWCATNDVDVKMARRCARKNQWPDGYDAPQKLFGVWVMDADAPAPKFPERQRGTRRADGRRRFIVYLNDDERDMLVADGYELIDMRERRRARRAAS